MGTSDTLYSIFVSQTGKTINQITSTSKPKQLTILMKVRPPKPPDAAVVSEKESSRSRPLEPIPHPPRRIWKNTMLKHSRQLPQEPEEKAVSEAKAIKNDDSKACPGKLDDSAEVEPGRIEVAEVNVLRLSMVC